VAGVWVEFKCELRVTVPLMILRVTMPPPPTSRDATLVEPFEVDVVVIGPEPDIERVAVLEEEVYASSAYKFDAVIWEPMDLYENMLPVKTADEVWPPVKVTTDGLLKPLPLALLDLEAEAADDTSEEAAVLSEDCALKPMASTAASQRLQCNM
jgi:hypothetical protein